MALIFSPFPLVCDLSISFLCNSSQNDDCSLSTNDTPHCPISFTLSLITNCLQVIPQSSKPAGGCATNTCQSITPICSIVRPPSCPIKDMQLLIALRPITFDRETVDYLNGKLAWGDLHAQNWDQQPAFLPRACMQLVITSFCVELTYFRCDAGSISPSFLP